MTAALQTTYTDLTGALATIAKPAAKPAKRGRDYSLHSKAMKMAWEQVRQIEAGSRKKVTAAHRGKLMTWAFTKLRLQRPITGTVYITREQASFIGSDCQYSDRRGI